MTLATHTECLDCGSPMTTTGALLATAADVLCGECRRIAVVMNGAAGPAHRAHQLQGGAS